MKLLELLPTEENLIETYKNDTIGRNNAIHYFFDLLNTTSERCSIAVDGNWGAGKTFFIKQVKMIFDAFNECSYNYNESTAKEIRSAYLSFQNPNEQRTLNSFVTLYYDAWENDNDEDPLLSIVYEILQGVKSSYSFDSGKDIVQLFTSIVDTVTGAKFTDIASSLRNKNKPLEEIRNSRNLKAKVNEFLESLLPEHGNRLIIFIDELDRCKPSFAIQLLERIKHYFDNEKITFVFSINACELNKTIQSYYGESFNANRYLDRFFDLRISLPKANMKRFYNSISLSSDEHRWCYITAKSVIETYGFELREITKYVFAIRVAVKKYLSANLYYTGYYPDDAARNFCADVIVPLLIGLKMYDNNLYYGFLKGQNSKPLLDVVKKIPYAKNLCNGLLSHAETFEETAGGEGKDIIKQVTIEEKLKAFYKALFVNESISAFCNISIGGFYITNATRTFIVNAANMLSELTDFISSDKE